MSRLFDWSARPVERTVTVASLIAGKGTPARHAQVTADTVEEAAAAEASGIEMVVCRAANVATVRQGSKRVFITAALGFAEAVTDDEILRAAFSALTQGADAVITGRRLAVVELLAAEDVPVMGHLGFVPRKSTWVGATRAVGKTLTEARVLAQRLRQLEEAGAFAVELELVPAALTAHLTGTSGLVTVSLGSGPSGDVTFLFSADICGETERTPRHARAYGNLLRLRHAIEAERLRAFSAFRADVSARRFPADRESVRLDDDILRMMKDQG